METTPSTLQKIRNQTPEVIIREAQQQGFYVNCDGDFVQQFKHTQTNYDEVMRRFNRYRDALDYTTARDHVATVYKQLVRMLGEKYRSAVTYQFRRVCGELRDYYDHEPNIR